MQELRTKAYAKINLTLDVLGKRADGYHQLETIMQTIDLADVLTLKERAQGIKIVSSTSDIPTDESNLAYKAAQLLLNHCQIKKGIEIFIEKNIPVAAGLAGGSADGAATLRGLNQLWELDLSDQQLWHLATQLGSDVAFCLRGGTCLAKGRGEILTEISSPPPLWVLVAKPKLAVSTASVYKSLKLDSIKTRPDNLAMEKALKEGNPEKIAQLLCNVLESVTLVMHPELVQIKEQIKDMGALGVLMSGSGPTIFAFTATQRDGQAMAKRLEDQMEAVFVTTTLAGICQGL